MESAKYTAQHVANFFLQKAEEEGRPISPLKLLKLVYIAYGWNLALTGTKLFDDEIQAWQHGPVVPSLYHEFKHFRADPITERAVSFDLESFDFTIPSIPPEDKDTLLILERVWEAYKSFSASTLRRKTHEPDTPWFRVYNEDDRNIVIPDTLIAEHFRKKITEYLHVAAQ